MSASGSGVLRGAVDAMSAAVDVAKWDCARASTLVGLVHQHLMPENVKVPAGLDARVAAFGNGGDLLEDLVGETVVSGLSTSLVVLMGHGVAIDDSLVETVPDYTDEQSERATVLARRLQKVVDAQYPSSTGKGGRSHVVLSETFGCNMPPLWW